MSRTPVVLMTSDQRALVERVLEEEGIDVYVAADAEQAVAMVKEVRSLMPGSRVPLERIVEAHIERTLKRNKGNKQQTADDLGIDRSTLYNKLRRMSS